MKLSMKYTILSLILVTLTASQSLNAASQSLNAAQRDDDDFELAIKLSLQGDSGVRPSARSVKEERASEDIPAWVLEESRNLARAGTSRYAAAASSPSSHPVPSSDIPEWVIAESKDLARKPPSDNGIPAWVQEEYAKMAFEGTYQRPAKEIQMDNDERLAKAIQASLGDALAEALPIIRYDPRVAHQEEELARLCNQCTQAVESGEKELAIALVNSFLTIDDLDPLIRSQAIDIRTTITDQVAQPLRAPVKEEPKPAPAAAVSSPSKSEPAASAAPTPEEHKMLELTNARRRLDGKHDLKHNLLLMAAARAHSENMAKLDQFAHEVEGKSVQHRVDAQRYRWSFVGENLAYAWSIGYPLTHSIYSVEHHIECLMNSPGHRANILSGNFTELGIGIHVTADGRKYFTQVFGTPR